MLKTFGRSAAVLATGSGGAQLILILVLPLLTRMYSPEDFGLLGVYSAILSVLSLAACFGYDTAVPAPKGDHDALNLLALAAVAASVVSVVVSIPVLFVPDQVGALLRQPLLVPYLWMLPLGVLLSGLYNALQFWFSRKKQFSAIAVNRITQVVIGSTTQIVLGRLALGPFGLLLGQLINAGAGSIGLLLRLRRELDESMRRGVTLPEMVRMLREHRAFAIYTTPGLIANSAAVQVPLVLVAATGGAKAGFLLIAMRVMQAPLTLVGNSISRVYYSQASAAERDGEIQALSEAILRSLARYGMGPLIFITIVAPDLFALAFGEGWRPAGNLVAWMAPWLAIQLLVSPISTALYATGNQQRGMLLQFCGLAIRILPVLLTLGISPEYASEVFCISGAVFYSVYLLVVTAALKIKFSRLMLALAAAVPGVILGSIVAVLIRLILAQI